MARRRQSAAEDVIDLVAKLPWYVGVVLALISYIGLHTYASKAFPITTGQDLTQAARGGMLYALATLFQYILPALFVLGAIVSLISRFQRKSLHQSVSRKEKSLDNISWQQFEQLAGEHFRQKGYQVEETESGADGGIDLIIRKDDQKYLVQCKHWKAYKVGVKPVRELLGVMAGSGAAGGYVITSGDFTVDAKVFARDNEIRLINGLELDRILSHPPQKTLKSSLSAQAENPINKEKPSCPKCGSDMVLRVARKGSRVGKEFWGCSAFPRCKSTIDVDDFSL